MCFDESDDDVVLLSLVKTQSASTGKKTVLNFFKPTKADGEIAQNTLFFGNTSKSAMER